MDKEAIEKILGDHRNEVISLLEKHYNEKNGVLNFMDFARDCSLIVVNELLINPKVEA